MVNSLLMIKHLQKPIKTLALHSLRHLEELRWSNNTATNSATRDQCSTRAPQELEKHVVTMDPATVYLFLKVINTVY